jgi:hypothetical protein
MLCAVNYGRGKLLLKDRKAIEELRRRFGIVKSMRIHEHESIPEMSVLEKPTMDGRLIVS